MNSRKNQTIAIARFLAYKSHVNAVLDNMSDDEYVKNPTGLEVGQYIEDLMKYCPTETVDKVLRNQSGLITRLGEEYLIILANMPYEGVSINA